MEVLIVEEITETGRVIYMRKDTEEGLLPRGEPTKADAQRATTTAERFMKSLRDMLTSQ